MYLSGNPITELLPDVAALIDSMPEPRLFIGADYRVLAANRAYREQFDVPEDLAQHFCYELSHHISVPCDQAGESCPLKSCRDTGEASRVLHIHHTPRGQEHVDVEVAPICDRAGRILFYAETVRTVRRVRSGPSAEGLVGRSPAFNRLIALLERVAPADATVLLLGESGTGKELAAQALHDASARARGPFVAVDCAGVTETLFGSELFGYEKGAFTGASTLKTGLVEAASGGTLFFDEIGDMPLCLQVKLLRLLESGTFRRVGGLEFLRANFRLVLATHRDIKSMVEEGTFRRDLYYRISAFPIRVPPLRERKGDLPLLVDSLLKRLCQQRRTLHPDALSALLRHTFPWNIRELRNILERACLLADGDTIRTEHLPDDLDNVSDCVKETTEEEILPLAEAERRYLRWALERHGPDRRLLAQKLGLGERTLYRKLKEAGV